jgi:hypothetical protein
MKEAIERRWFEMEVGLSGDPIYDWVHQPIPEKLWHYTSVQGFQGIIASGNIYATDVRFLNDSEEFVHARKVANEVVEHASEFGELGFPLRDVLKSAVNGVFASDFLDPNRAQIFVASFTDSADDLSQWRGYSHGTFGVSISFDLRMHRPIVESDSAVTFAPCIYDDDEKRNLIQFAIHQFVKESQAKWTETVKEFLNDFCKSKTKPEFTEILKVTTAAFDNPAFKAKLNAGLNIARQHLHRLSGLLKHRAFYHEREWGLVLPISPDKDKTDLVHPIRFRSTGASLIPYIEFPLGMISMAQGSGATPTPILPVNDVLLGPGASVDAANAALAFLESESIKIVPSRSDVPYRQARNRSICEGQQ